MSSLRYLHLAYFSQPAGDRLLFRLIRRHRIRRIVELGVGLGVRSIRMIQVAARYSSAHRVHYAGIDRFESRSEAAGPGLSIKMAHQMLGPSGAHIQLVPGCPLDVLARKANSLRETDLLVVAADQDGESLAQSWFYVPRMLHSHSLVLVEQPTGRDGTSRWRATPPEELAMLASIVPARRAA